MGELSDIIEVYRDLNRLKQIKRSGWKRYMDASIVESDADHSFGMALIGYIVAKEYFPQLNADHVLKMGLAHELGEIDVGDLTPYDHVSREEKEHREEHCMQRVFSHLCSGSEFVELRREYAQGTTPEACFKKQMDKIEMALQALVYEWQLPQIDLEEFYVSALERINHPILRKLYAEIYAARPPPAIFSE